MSRVHIDAGLITTIQEEENQSLSSEALAEHERQHAPLSCPRGPRGRRGTVDMSSSDKSSEMEQRRLRRMSKRAVEVTRRLSVSSALFSQLHGFLAKHGAGAGEPKYENTYCLEPKEGERFLRHEVTDIVERVLKEKLTNVAYDPAICSRLCCSLSNVIRSRIHENLDLPRYKLIVYVLIGERKGQSLQMASRCLWNETTDRWASASYQNNTLFAVATVHGIYFD